MAAWAGPAKGLFGISTCWGGEGDQGAGQAGVGGGHRGQAGIRVGRFRREVGNLGKALGERENSQGRSESSGGDIQGLWGRPRKVGIEGRALQELLSNLFSEPELT